MRREYLKLTQVSPNWFILKGLGVAFFGHSTKQVTRAYWDYMQSANRQTASSEQSTRVAEKMIQAGAH
tara:strand:- start:422 stop:625 length:204 start_codon:yes stop_codon:yes gene_type:complete